MKPLTYWEPQVLCPCRNCAHYKMDAEWCNEHNFSPEPWGTCMSWVDVDDLREEMTSSD